MEKHSKLLDDDLEKQSSDYTKIETEKSENDEATFVFFVDIINKIVIFILLLLLCALSIVMLIITFFDAPNTILVKLAFFSLRIAIIVFFCSLLLFHRPRRGKRPDTGFKLICVDFMLVSVYLIYFIFLVTIVFIWLL